MREIIRKNIIFFIPYLILLIILSFIQYLYDKPEIHIFINSYHNIFFNFFFKYITCFGSGYFALFIFIVLLFVKYKWALVFAVSNILTGAVVQILKRAIFDDHFRPTFYFAHFYEKSYELFIIPGTEPTGLYSFPSGHTATAFAIFLLLALISNKNYWKLFFFISAVFISYSRIYLSWHFLEDTLLGSLIGMTITFFTYLLINRLNSKVLDNKIHLKQKILKN